VSPTRRTCARAHRWRSEHYAEGKRLGGPRPRRGEGQGRAAGEGARPDEEVGREWRPRARGALVPGASAPRARAPLGRELCAAVLGARSNAPSPPPCPCHPRYPGHGEELARALAARGTRRREGRRRLGLLPRGGFHLGAEGRDSEAQQGAHEDQRHHAGRALHSRGDVSAAAAAAAGRAEDAQDALAPAGRHMARRA
jgi:hypothetical protein